MATAEQIKSFINTLGALAVAESNRRIANGQGFVLPSVCIAQSALETGWGTSGLMTRANAYFGIKAGGSWTGAVYTADTWEVANGEAYNTTANFRAYSSLADSVKDYYDLIGNNSRYAGALSFELNQAEWKTPKQCITAIWSGGYATDTLYVEKIMSTINARNLAEWDTKIDGVSFNSVPSYSFTILDMIQGKLIISDNGRSIQNDRTSTGGIALNWEKAFTIPNDNAKFNFDYNIERKDNSDYLHFFRYFILRGDTAIETETLPDNFTFQKDDKVGFYIYRTERNDPDRVIDINISDYKVINVQFKNPNTIGGDIDNSARYDEPIAFFVKVE